MSTSVLQMHHHRLHAQSLQAGESPRLQEVSLSLLQNMLARTSVNITRALILHSSNLVEPHSAHHTGVLSFLCLVTGKAGMTPHQKLFSIPALHRWMTCYMRNTGSGLSVQHLLSLPTCIPDVLQDPDSFYCPREGLEGFKL